jgi:cytochrome c553
MATGALTGVYGGWQAVENSGIALAEAANLLTIPGRVCSNGRPVPLADPDWGTFVQGLRDAGMAAQKAAAEKNQDAFLDVSDRVASACANCHDTYREKTAARGGTAARCTK